MAWRTDRARLCPRGQAVRWDNVGKGAHRSVSTTSLYAMRLCPPYSPRNMEVCNSLRTGKITGNFMHFRLFWLLLMQNYAAVPRLLHIIPCLSGSGNFRCRNREWSCRNREFRPLCLKTEVIAYVPMFMNEPSIFNLCYHNNQISSRNIMLVLRSSERAGSEDPTP